MTKHSKKQKTGHEHKPQAHKPPPHKDWRAWVVVGLMLAAMLGYILSMDEAIEPGGGGAAASTRRSTVSRRMRPQSLTGNLLVSGSQLISEDTVDHQLQAIVTLLALVNPAMCAAIFLRSAGMQPRRAQLVSASTAAVTVLVILVLAALFGAKILHAFGVSLDAFSVAGGGVLSWIGFGMLRGSPGDAKQDDTTANPQQPTLTPLILFAASPGTITGVITLAVSHSKLSLPVTALVAVVVATTAMWLVILLAIFLADRGQKDVNKQQAAGGFVRDTVTRFMGLIVIAMGVQFALTGIKSFMST